MRREFDLEVSVPMTLTLEAEEDYINSFRGEDEEDEDDVLLKAFASMLYDVCYDVSLQKGFGFNPSNGYVEIKDIYLPAEITDWEETTSEEDD